jgi:hypothetical protein
MLGSTVEIDSKYIHEPDLVTMAGGVKRALEEAARKEETAAEASGKEAALCLKSVEGIDIDKPCDETELKATQETAIRRQAAMRAQADDAERARQNHQSAVEALRRAESGYTGKTSADAKLDLDIANAEQVEAAKSVRELEEQLRSAHERNAMAQAKVERCELQHDNAVGHEATLASWRKQVEAAQPTGPTEDELTAAGKAVTEATQALQQGAIVRNAKAKAAQAEEWTEKRKNFLLKAEQWRKSAAAVDSVLSDQIASLECPIKVGEDAKGLRLVIKHRRSEHTLFSELSEGERWGVVIPIAIHAVGKNGVFVLPQEAWEGLQPNVRLKMRQQLEGSTVTMVTAQADDGELCAEVVA